MRMDTGAKRGIVAGKKYRFEVRSAEEAVRTIQERMGKSARVLSVKQAGGRGMARFLSSPRLEIIAMVPPPPRLLDENEVEEWPAPNFEEGGREAEREGFSSVKPGVTGVMALGREKEMIWDMLKRAGFGDSLLSGFKYSPEWRKLRQLSLPQALAEIAEWLRRNLEGLERRPVGNRIALFGTPAVGKTTVLCKRLAKDVFIHRKHVQVLKLESDAPNPDDALSVFCEVLGVNLLREPFDERSLNEGNVLYLDLPGVGLSEESEWKALRQRLDLLKVDTRALVVNAAYESGLISEAYEFGHRISATHVVFTHMDEVREVSKLWQFLLKGGLTPLLFSFGQNVTSDFSEDVVGYLSGRAFPFNFRMNNNPIKLNDSVDAPLSVPGQSDRK